MKDKGAVFKNAASMGIVVGLWTLFSLMAADAAVLLEGLTVVVFITVIALFVEDCMEKAFTDTKLFTWQYLLLGLFIGITDCLWLYFASCMTWLQFALRGLLMAASAAGAFCWYWFCYRISVMSDRELLIRALAKAYRKAAKTFPTLDDEGVRNALKETLFCRLEGDNLEGDLLTGQPFTADCRTFNQVADSSDLPGQEKSAALTNIASYISMLIERRHKDDTTSAS